MGKRIPMRKTNEMKSAPRLRLLVTKGPNGESRHELDATGLAPVVVAGIALVVLAAVIFATVY